MNTTQMAATADATPPCQPARSTTPLGVVVIGRNEGERLRRCFASLSETAALIVYVDSGSTDGSLDLARQLGVQVVPLDLSTPLYGCACAQRGFCGTAGPGWQFDSGLFCRRRLRGPR
jgi:glycosyltransferase involved in cell wall biosynthesis